MLKVYVVRSSVESPAVLPSHVFLINKVFSVLSRQISCINRICILCATC